MEAFITLALILLLAVREYMAHVERKDMLDRLMARSLPEYKDNAKIEENQFIPKEDEDIQDLDTAKEELMHDEQ